MRIKNILLASFVPREKIDEALETISRKTNIDSSKIFIFKTGDNNEYVFTFNIDPENANIKFSSIWKDTISIHRKKETNTLFSLNALNEIIKKNNNGQLNSAYQVDWEKYSNSFLLIRNGRLNVIAITLIKLNR